MSLHFHLLDSYTLSHMTAKINNKGVKHRTCGWMSVLPWPCSNLYLRAQRTPALCATTTLCHLRLTVATPTKHQNTPSASEHSEHQSSAQQTRPQFIRPRPQTRLITSSNDYFYTISAIYYTHMNTYLFLQLLPIITFIKIIIFNTSTWTTASID